MTHWFHRPVKEPVERKEAALNTVVERLETLNSERQRLLAQVNTDRRDRHANG